MWVIAYTRSATIEVLGHTKSKVYLSNAQKISNNEVTDTSVPKTVLWLQRIYDKSEAYFHMVTTDIPAFFQRWLQPMYPCISAVVE
jgi:hypothetical protein